MNDATWRALATHRTTILHMEKLEEENEKLKINEVFIKETIKENEKLHKIRENLHLHINEARRERDAATERNGKLKEELREAKNNLSHILYTMDNAIVKELTEELQKAKEDFQKVKERFRWIKEDRLRLLKEKVEATDQVIEMKGKFREFQDSKGLREALVNSVKTIDALNVRLSNCGHWAKVALSTNLSHVVGGQLEIIIKESKGA